MPSQPYFGSSCSSPCVTTTKCQPSGDDCAIIGVMTIKIGEQFSVSLFVPANPPISWAGIVGRELLATLRSGTRQAFSSTILERLLEPLMAVAMRQSTLWHLVHRLQFGLLELTTLIFRSRLCRRLARKPPEPTNSSSVTESQSFHE